MLNSNTRTRLTPPPPREAPSQLENTTTHDTRRSIKAIDQRLFTPMSPIHTSIVSKVYGESESTPSMDSTAILLTLLIFDLQVLRHRRHRSLLHTQKVDGGSNQELFSLDVQQLLRQENQFRRDLLASTEPALHQMERSTDQSIDLEGNLQCK